MKTVDFLETVAACEVDAISYMSRLKYMNVQGH